MALINLDEVGPNGQKRWPALRSPENAPMGFYVLQNVTVVDQAFDASVHDYAKFIELCALSATAAPITAAPFMATRDASVRPASSGNVSFTPTSLGARIGYDAAPVGSSSLTCAGFIVTESAQNFATTPEHTMQVEYYNDFAGTPQTVRQQFDITYMGEVQNAGVYAIFPMTRDTNYSEPSAATSWQYGSRRAGTKNFLMPFTFQSGGGIYIQWQNIPDDVTITVQPILINAGNLSSLADLLGR